MLKCWYGQMIDRFNEATMQEETQYQLAKACDLIVSVTAKLREETNQVVSSKDHVAVIKHYDALRKETAHIKEAREALNNLEERLSREYIPDVMRASNIRSTTIEGVGRVSLSQRWSASMLEKESAMNWLRNNGNGGVIQETVNAQTLGALAKELNSTGFELPQDLFKTNIMTFTSITKV